MLWYVAGILKHITDEKNIKNEREEINFENEHKGVKK